MSRPQGIYPSVPDEDYFADDAFSQSQAKVLLESPARYLWAATQPVVISDAFDLGHAVHAEVLGVGLPVVEIPADLLASNGAVSTKAAKEFVAEAREAGRVPLVADVIRQVRAMTQAVLDNAAARAAFEAEGDVELSMWWADPESGVECRGRIDKAAATEGGISLVDLKSTVDGSPRAFASSAAKYGYRFQGGAYSDGWEVITGDAPAGFLFVTVEKEAPYLVGTYSLSPWDIEAGRLKWREACARLTDYRAREEWPAYATELPDFAHLDLPAWAL